MMEQTNLASFILERYQNGQRRFENLDLSSESFEGQNLEGIIFDGCLLSANFRGANLKNATFINGGIKTCNFRDADLSGAHFENLSVESSEFAGSKTENTYFNNNFAYGQSVTQDDFEDWIKYYPENHYQDELKRLKTILQQLDKYLEGTNYEPHFQVELLCDSTQFEQILPAINKQLLKPANEHAFQEIAFREFKSELMEKIHYTGKPGPNDSQYARDAVQLIENNLFQLIGQKFHPDKTCFYRAPHNNDWIFWNFSFLIVSKERNKSYLFHGGASD